MRKDDDAARRRMERGRGFAHGVGLLVPNHRQLREGEHLSSSVTKTPGRGDQNHVGRRIGRNETYHHAERAVHYKVRESTASHRPCGVIIAPTERSNGYNEALH
jgi:hypothetical protein